MQKKLIILSMSAILLLMTSCTKLDLMLRWADTYVMSYVNDYFELNSQGKSQTKEEFNSVLSNIQKEDFPIYAFHLNQLADDLEKNQLNEKNIEKFLTNAEAILKKSTQKFEPFLQKLIANQAKTNFNRFDEEFSEKQKKDLGQYDDIRKIAKEQKKRFSKWVNETIEFLTDEQEREFNDLLLTYPAPMKLQIESRQALFEKFKAIRMEPQARQKLVSDFFYQWESLQTPAYLEVRAVHRERFKNFLIKLGSELNQKQKQNFLKNLRKRATELKALSER